jgi:hypothetical protein
MWPLFGSGLSLQGLLRRRVGSRKGGENLSPTVHCQVRIRESNGKGRAPSRTVIGD